MFDSSSPSGLGAAATLGRRADGVVVDVSRLLGHRSIEPAMLESVLAGEPDPELVALLTEVELLPLTETEAAIVAQAWERVGRWISARQHQAFLRVAGLGEREGRSDHVDLGVEEARIALGLSPGQADRRATLARELATRLPLTAAALEVGEISPGHVSVLVDLTAGRSAEVAARVEQRVLVRAPHQTVAAFKRCVRRALVRFDPLGEALAHLQAAGRRDVIRYEDAETGLCTVVATMPVVDGLIVWNTLDARARRDRAADKARLRTEPQPAGDRPATVGSLGGYRADTLLRWAQQDLAEDGAPRPQRRPLEVNVVIDLPSLMSLADNPAEIPGYGPLPATIARLLAEDAHWRRFVTDPVSGHLLDYGHTVYEPPQALRDYVVARDRSCIAPHCDRPSAQGQLDHLDPFPRRDGLPNPSGGPPGVGPPGDPPPKQGATSATNVRPECTWHHLLKTHHGWAVRRRADGSVVWSSPGGRAYLVAPQAVLPE